MKNLLKADFYRLLKNKLVIISSIIAVALPFLIIGMMYGLKMFLKATDPDTADMFDILVNSHTMVSSAFSFTNNFGIVLPVFAALIVMADITSGTIRNKIILGYSRHKIFASHFIVTMTYCIALIAIYAAFTTLASVLILGVGQISAERATSLAYFYVLGIFNYVVVSAFATMIALLTLNGAGTVILTIAFCLVIGLIAQLVGAFDYSKYEHFVNFIPGFITVVFQLKEITLVMFLEGLGGSLLFSGLFYLAGTLGFARKDLK